MKLDTVFAVKPALYSSDEPSELVAKAGTFDFEYMVKNSPTSLTFFDSEAEALREAEERCAVKRLGFEKAFQVERGLRRMFEAYLRTLLEEKHLDAGVRAMIESLFVGVDSAFRLPPPAPPVPVAVPAPEPAVS